MMLGDHVLLAFIGYYLAVAPYTKVEESFNMQAIHDMLYYTGDLELYDHNQFPGVVPRTSIGAFLISAAVRPFLVYFKMSKFHTQLFARGILAIFNVVALLVFKRAIKHLYGPKRGRQIANWFVLLTLGQFHIIFYVSRTLPNMLAFPLVLISFSLFLGYNYANALRLLAFTAVVFRSELAIMCICIAACLLYTKKLSLLQIVLAGLSGLFVGIVATVTVDSVFWGKFPSFPELEGVIFNVFEGKSAEWGVEPWDAYFRTHLPNLLAGPLPIFWALFALKITPRNLQMLGVACFLYIAIYSFQPHKELRFVIYVAPVITSLSARGIDYLYYTKWSKSLVTKIVVSVTLVLSLASVALALIKLHISANNYPGGVALEWFNTNIAVEGTTVHLDVTACMTGVTRFLQSVPGVVYDKTENQSALMGAWGTFDYFIGADLKDVPEGVAHFQPIKSIDSFAGINARGIITLLKCPKHLLGAALSLFTDRPAFIKAIKELWSSVVNTEPKLFIYKKISE